MKIEFLKLRKKKEAESNIFGKSSLIPKILVKRRVSTTRFSGNIQVRSVIVVLKAIKMPNLR